MVSSINLSMISAAALGLIAKTELNIFTPAGNATTGFSNPTESKISRAVPSPPQKISKSIFSLIICFAILLVSSSVVSLPISPTILKSIPRFLAISAPILPGATIRMIFSLFFTFENNSFARIGVTGVAPIFTASL
ncbi:hypothetical protein ES703_81960 [subsurface metagenome]